MSFTHVSNIEYTCILYWCLHTDNEWWLLFSLLLWLSWRRWRNCDADWRRKPSGFFASSWDICSGLMWDSRPGANNNDFAMSCESGKSTEFFGIREILFFGVIFIPIISHVKRSRLSYEWKGWREPIKFDWLGWYFRESQANWKWIEKFIFDQMKTKKSFEVSELSERIAFIY